MKFPEPGPSHRRPSPAESDPRHSTSRVEPSTPESEWYLLESGPGAAGWNMALDEALLQAMPRLGKPVLRFYGWTEPAASFGYFQRYAEVERATPLRPLVRRPTGGGIVPHQSDWTYSLAFPARHPWYGLRALESYRLVHEWIQSAFARLGLDTELAVAARKSSPGQCFAGYEQFDLLRLGGKIAGAAQRRTRDGLLIQGSIQFAGHLDDAPASPKCPAVPGANRLTRAGWQESMRTVAAAQGVAWREFALETGLNDRAAELVSQKYGSPAFHRSR